MAVLGVGLFQRLAPEIPRLVFNGIDRFCSLGQKVLNIGTYVAKTTTTRVKNPWQTVLPYLGVPNLEGSIEKIKKVAELELSEQEYSAFCLEAENFKKGEGIRLQSMLRVYALTRESWIDKLWEMGVYLLNRKSPLESSHWTGFFPKIPQELERFSDPQEKMIVRAAVTIQNLAEYQKKLLEGSLQEDMVFKWNGKLSLDASKCKKVFGTFRRPQKDFDALIEHPESRHIIILVKGQIFPLTLYKEERIKTVDELICDLRNILASSKKHIDDISYLSSQDRDSWAKDYKTLKEQNPQFEVVESALGAIRFVEEDAWKDRASAALHGFQTIENCIQDVAPQLTFRKGGDCYARCPHEAYDATHIAPVIEYTGREEKAKIATANYPQEKADPTIKPLSLNLSKEMKEKIAALKEKPSPNPDLEIVEMDYQEFGKDLLKSAGHPDSVMQMAFQLAYGLMHKEQNVFGANTYEAMNMRHFKGWRTAQAHPRSKESEEFVKAAVTKQGEEKILSALKKATQALLKDQTEIGKGNSFDRHLYALYCIARKDDKMGQNSAHPFLETVMTRLQKYPLSTSQLPQKEGKGGCFLPSEETGFGIFYQIHEKNSLKAFISSKSKEEGKRAQDFKKYLIEALGILKPLLEKAQSEKKEVQKGVLTRFASLKI